MNPGFFALSPACGLVALSATTFASNAYSLALPPGHLHGLCRELYHRPGDGGALRAATSQSRVAAHLSPQLFGHIVGLSVTGANPAQVKDCLGALGVATNRINGEWTGVSFERFQRLVRLINGLWREEKHASSTSLLMRFLWEKARSKNDLLDFLQALHTHVQVLLPAFADADAAHRQQWLLQSFTAPELENEEALLEAAALVLEPSVSDLQFAHCFELLAASCSSIHSFRSAIHLERHSYKGGKEVPDCVEVVVREILELLTFDSKTRSVDASRLPASAAADVVRYFGRAMRREFSSSREASAEWYAICQVIVPQSLNREQSACSRRLMERRTSSDFIKALLRRC